LLHVDAVAGSDVECNCCCCCRRGALFTALIVLYALTACIAGYVATSYYVQMEGQGWVQNILVTCFCYCGPFFCMFMFLNTVAIVYRVRRGAAAAADLWC
jgi:hypothetical protein